MNVEDKINQTTKAYEAIKVEWDQLTKPQNDVNTLFDSLFENSKILTFVDDNGGIWFKGSDIARVLEYANTKQCIIEHVEECDKISFSKMKSNPNFFPGLKTKGLRNRPFISGMTIFINESGINSLILGSKKPIAKRFQKWLTSEVIPSIRLKGKYVHKEHKPKRFIENGIPTFTNKSILNDNTVKQYLEQYHNDAKINVPDYDCLHKLLKESKINVQFFDRKNVLYYFITSITNIIDKRVIVKLGYTADLMERYSSLQREYDSKFVLVGVKVINSQQDEKQFHRLLKNKYSELNYKIKLGDKCKDELYYYDDRLTQEFYEFTAPKAQVSDKDIKLAKYKAIEAIFLYRKTYCELKKAEFELERAKLNLK